MVKHVGSAHTKQECADLRHRAERYVAQIAGQVSLLPDTHTSEHLVDLRTCRFHGVLYTLAYEALCQALRRLGFRLPPLLRDLTVMRIIEPSSKLRSLQLLAKRFGIQHRRQTFYEMLPTLLRRKRTIEKRATAFACKNLSFDCSLVLYDVTTLYFESFREDEPEDKEKGLRKTGFSKDNKPQQPQVVVGLLVTPEGFPLAYDVFRGNTFEGHTMLPLLLKFKKRHDVRDCTVVADAAMLSEENTEELRKKKLSYIVGARTANLSHKRISEVSASLKKRDGATMRMSTRHGDLICAFSQKRYKKDKYEMEQQIARAKKLVQKGEPGRKAKFIRKEGGTYVFNEKLRKKTEQLLGIKGYYTNIPQKRMADMEIIKHYRNLWRVEQSFRMSKHDLEMRPIFHRYEDPIRAHLLICFMALAVGKYLELATKRSLRQVLDALMEVTDAVITDEHGKQVILRSEMPENAQEILKLLGVSY